MICSIFRSKEIFGELCCRQPRLILCKMLFFGLIIQSSVAGFTQKQQERLLRVGEGTSPTNVKDLVQK